MVWFYLEESGEYRAGKLVNMTMGGIVSRCEPLKALDGAWQAALQKEGLTYFHMTDFEAWRPPFNFELPDGSRDSEKHDRLLNGLLDVMLAHGEGFEAFTSDYFIQDDGRGHGLAMETCAIAAVTHAVHDLWERYQQPINLVFAKQRHFSFAKIAEVVELYNWGDGKGRLGAVLWDEPQLLPQLQAADIWSFEAGKAQRENRPERYPFRRLRQGASERKIPFQIKSGPFLNLRGFVPKERGG